MGARRQSLMPFDNGINTRRIGVVDIRQLRSYPSVLRCTKRANVSVLDRRISKKVPTMKILVPVKRVVDYNVKIG